MTLKPLGLKDSLIQPSSLEPLRSPPPLEQSLTPLGPSLQPLGNSVMQPLLEVNEDWELGNWQLDAGMQGGEDAGNFAGRISRFSDDRLSIIDRTEINSQASETLPSQKLEENYPTNSGGENESLSANAEALNTSESPTNNIAQLKPLGISKPLIQTAGLEISSLSELPQFVQKQSTPSLEIFGSVSEESSSLSNSISTELSDSMSTEPSDLPVISSSNNRYLGFNDRLISPFIAELLPQQPTIYTEKLNLTTEDSPPASTINRGEVEAIAPDSLNLISPQIYPLSSQESVSLQPEISQEHKQDLTVSTKGQVEASGASSLDLIQSKPAPTSPQKITASQPETLVQKTEDLTDTTEGDVGTIAPTSPNLIQSKIYPSLSQESYLLSPYINKEQQGLTAKTEAEAEALAADSSNLIQTKVSSTPTQEIIAPQLETIQEQQNLTVKTDGQVETSLLSPSNLIQSQLAPTSSQEITSPQSDTLVQKTEDLTDTTEGDVGTIAPTSLNLIQAQPSPTLLPKAIAKQQDLRAQTEVEIEVEASVATSPNSIQSKASPVSTQEAGLLQLESTGEETKNLIEEGEMSVATSPNSIQSKASPVSTQEAGLLQLESLPEATEGLTEEEGETSIATSPNLIQSKASPATSQEASLLQLESLPEETEENTDDSTAQNDGGEVQESTTDLSKSISAKVSPALNQEIVSPQLETSQEQQQDLIARSEPEVETSVATSPNSTQSPTSSATSQEASLLQLESLVEHTEENTDDSTAQNDGGEVQESTTDLSKSISAKLSSIPTQEIVSPQVEISQEKQQDLTARTEPEVGTIAPAFGNLTQTQLSPSSLPEATGEQQENLTAQAEGEVKAIAPTSSNLIQSQASSTSPPEAIGEEKDFTINTTSQGRLERSNLNSIEPLGNSMPLAKMSGLFLSNFVTDAVNKPLAFSQENHLLFNSSKQNISQSPEKYLAEVSGATNLEDTRNIAQVENIPNSWSNISELLGETTNGVTANIDYFKPLGLSQGLNNSNNLILPHLQTKHINGGDKQNNVGFDTPTSWSNISELLGKNYTGKSENIQAKEQVTPAPLREQESSPSYTLLSPDSSGNSLPTASPETSQQIIGGYSTKNTSIDDEQLEHLAQKVYTLMRQWLEIEQERQGNQSAGYPTWLSNITSVYGTSAKVRATPKQSTPGQQPADATGEVSPVDDKLQKLAREIYYLTRQRLEIEQERQGGYWIDR
ncbi:hypothetical protein [Microcoleus sp. herbarium5]|uniref:hypothetical protein n=1 Tax=Microcoleus sp. herbarium5 TaxID=3055434 RepID=UPI002FD12A34